MITLDEISRRAAQQKVPDLTEVSASLGRVIEHLDEVESSAERCAKILTGLEPEYRNRLMVAAMFCPGSQERPGGRAVLRMFRVPPQLRPELPFLVVPAGKLEHAYWAFPEHEYRVRCRCHNRRDVSVSVSMLFSAEPPPPGYRMV